MLFASEVPVDELVGLMMDLPLCVSNQILDVRLIDGRLKVAGHMPSLLWKM